jgi:hypothetical protein
VQREQRQLDAHADGDEGERHPHRARVVHRRQALRQVRHVEGAGHHVHQADADEDEGCTDGAHDQVLEGGGKRAAVPAEADQHVGRQRGDFQEHEQVEGIAGDHDAEQAGEAQQITGVEGADVLIIQLLYHAAPGIGHDHGADDGDDKDHQGGEHIDAVLDTPGRGPGTEGVGDGALEGDLAQ